MKKETKQASWWIRILKSSAITPILGVFALGSIIYYKANFVPPDEKVEPKKSSQSKKFYLGEDTLGKTRKDGPILTKSLFYHGDLLFVKEKGEIKHCMVEKQKNTNPVCWLPKAQKVSIVDWIKARGGRFALVHNQKSTSFPLLLELHQKPSLDAEKLKNLLQKNGWATQKASTLQEVFQQMVQKSHYNDMKE